MRFASTANGSYIAQDGSRREYKKYRIDLTPEEAQELLDAGWELGPLHWARLDGHLLVAPGGMEASSKD